jgi:hypothetical protein
LCMRSSSGDTPASSLPQKLFATGPAVSASIQSCRGEVPDTHTTVIPSADPTRCQACCPRWQVANTPRRTISEEEIRSIPSNSSPKSCTKNAARYEFESAESDVGQRRLGWRDPRSRSLLPKQERVGPATRTTSAKPSKPIRRLRVADVIFPSLLPTPGLLRLACSYIVRISRLGRSCDRAVVVSS